MLDVITYKLINMNDRFENSLINLSYPHRVQ